MLTYSMGVSIDGFIADRDGVFDWVESSDQLLDFQLEHVAGLGGYLLGRRLHETMRVWETDATMRSTPWGATFADVWAALPKVVFAHGEAAVAGSARRATAPLVDEVAAAVASTDRPVSIGGAALAAQAIAQGLVDEFRILRIPVVVGGGTPYLPLLPAAFRLDLREHRRFPHDVTFDRYRRAGA